MNQRAVKFVITHSLSGWSLTDALYSLLMELSTTKHSAKDKMTATTHSLTSLACSCLLSMVIARGDTGKILSAIAVALMSQRSLATEEIKVWGRTGIVTMNH